jgi:hypothetical protein
LYELKNIGKKFKLLHELLVGFGLACLKHRQNQLKLRYHHYAYRIILIGGGDRKASRLAFLIKSI